MRLRSFQLIGVAAVIALVSVTMVLVSGRAPAPASTAAPRTPWGEPDLQGIWTVELQVPLERPAGVIKEFYTEAEVAELDKQRATAAHVGGRIAKRGTEADVSGAYNSVFFSVRRTGRRTSLIVDPPEGKLPPLTAEAQKRRAAFRQYQLALMQATEGCKNKVPGACDGGTYGPPSPRRLEWPPEFWSAGVGHINRYVGYEVRCSRARYV